eukprot:1091893-Rhodomonas_salina.1
MLAPADTAPDTRAQPQPHPPPAPQHKHKPSTLVLPSHRSGRHAQTHAHKVMMTRQREEGSRRERGPRERQWLTESWRSSSTDGGRLGRLPRPRTPSHPQPCSHQTSRHTAPHYQGEVFHTCTGFTTGPPPDPAHARLGVSTQRHTSRTLARRRRE